MTNHRLDIGMGNSIEFVEFQLVIWANVDVSTLVFSTITVLGCGEY